jgi:hypothetical protein
MISIYNSLSSISKSKVFVLVLLTVFASTVTFVIAQSDEPMGEIDSGKDWGSYDVID